MEFCEKCGSCMTMNKDGLQCPKCGNVVHVRVTIQSKKEKRMIRFDGIYVSTDQKGNYPKTIRECPKCGNKKASHWFSGFSGEHAGIRRERTVQHFRCTKCSHTWTEES